MKNLPFLVVLLSSPHILAESSEQVKKTKNGFYLKLLQ